MTGGFWECAFCKCSHIEMPSFLGEEEHIVAVEARACPDTFEAECPECGKVYKCDEGCTFLGPLVEQMIRDGMVPYEDEGYEDEG